MTWYAESPDLRRRQIAVDVVVALWVLLWLRVASAVHDGVQRLAGPGADLEDAGNDLAGGLSGAAERAGSVPGIGGGLRAPLDAAASAGEAVAGAGWPSRRPSAPWRCCSRWRWAGSRSCGRCCAGCPGRLRWGREHAAAARLRGDVDLLALRAAVSAPLHELAALGPDPVTRWRAGDPDAGRALAALELRRLGLQPAGAPSPQQA
jgi:hypothetical protein